MYASTATGVVELYTWDRDTDTHRQATDREGGTYLGALDPSGEQLWWFADDHGDGWGVWMHQPFAGGAAEPALPGLAAAYPAGLAIGSGVVVAGRSTDTSTTVHLVREGYEFTLYENAQPAFVGGMSRDESLLCLSHSEHGDPWHRALRVVGIEDGSRVADLWDGPGKDLVPSGFSPVKGDSRLLVTHERHGRSALLIWDPTSGACDELSIDLPGEIDADWFPDGTALLICHDHAARTELHRFDLTSQKLTLLESPAGVISSATARPDGTVEFSWSSSASPQTIRSTSGSLVLPAPDGIPESERVEDFWIDGPGGPIHALIARPNHLLPPFSTIFLLHRGADLTDDDTFQPRRAAWVDAGYCVVQVNHRGSAGYGPDWHDAVAENPGLVQLEDLAAVREWVVARHLAHPERCLVVGGSLALLSLGAQPDLWAAGVAIAPIADHLVTYEDEVEPLRAIDRALFGGSPEEAPERYARASAISYADKLSAPVLILAADGDPRCPTRQLDGYLARLRELGKDHEVYRHDAPPGGIIIDDQIRQMDVELDFALRHVRP